MKVIKGTSVSPGFSVGKVYFIRDEEIIIKKDKIENSEKEVDRLKNAIKEAEKQIKKIKLSTEKKMGKEKGEIFEAHLEILNDPELFEKTKMEILNNKVNSSFAFSKIANETEEFFKSLNDEYMKERAADIRDISTRVINILEGREIKDLSTINEETILFAYDLSPSETSQLDPKFIKGFVTEIGGTTSHTAIMSRTLGIPAIVGVGKDLYLAKENQSILLNANEGIAILDPSEKELKLFREQEQAYKKIEDEEKTFKKLSSKTKDGWKTKISLNIGSPENLSTYKDLNAEGVGLFRTEFLYMESDHWPTEEEQFQAYKKALEIVKNEIVVIRALDIGGDKTLKYFSFPKEQNPFLGYRAIRMLLDKKDIFITQIRALLRASKYGNLAINIPMISTIEEVKEAKELVKKVENDLKKEGQEIGNYQFGIMVEVPSVVELADKFIKYVDFFSIGTNDLIQYTFAIDRMSKEVSYLYQPLNPSTLKMINKIIEESHKAGKWTAICGELAREPKLAPLFAAMGLDEFSMSAPSILKIRRILSKIDKKETEVLLKKVLDSETEAEVDLLVSKYFNEKQIFY